MKITFLSCVEVNIRAMTDGLAPRPVAIARTRDALMQNIADTDILIAQNQGFPPGMVDATVLDAARRLQLIQHHGAGMDVTDRAAAAAHGIAVATSPGQNSRSVAEHAMYLLLAHARQARAAARLVGMGRMGELVGTELQGKTLCILGFGNIGQAIAQIASGFDMNVIAVRRHVDPERQLPPGVNEMVPIDALHEALQRARFLMLALPLTPETTGIIGAAALRSLPDDAAIVNISRGAHVDRPALEQALLQDQIGGYATDVWWTEPADPADPLLADERIILSPHIGGKSSESIARSVGAARENVERVEMGKPPVGLVPFD